MGLLDPIPPPYDPLEWEKTAFPEKSRMVCRSWAVQGYGTPLSAYAFYLLKLALYVGGWMFFCSFSTDVADVWAIGDWWLRPVAFIKAILFSMLFEVVGLGCGSGPLTGRYWPPFGGALYFLRAGTTKLPLFPNAPIVGGHRRTYLDAFLYLALIVALERALLADHVTGLHLLPIAILVPLLGLLDKTIFLAARSEHYWVVVMVLLFAPNWIAGSKVVWLALWFWAGVSKLNRHFPSVVCVMTSNSPITRFAWMRKLMYRSYPDDLRPSAMAVTMAHMGTMLELGTPAVLIFADGGTLTIVGLGMMVLLHTFITSNVPMGVPIEWNVIMVYGACFLFGEHAGMSVFDVGSVPVYALLITTCVAVPLLGNLFPDKISFLMSMRYYAGNWAYSIWLFKGETYRKLDVLTKSSAWIYDQLDRFYDRATAVGLVGKVIAFRQMHLHGRAIPQLLPKAIGDDDVNDYEWVDGEIVAGMVLGYNFGDGHLHDERLLRAVQKQCDFEEGELRCIFVESQPMFGKTLAWRTVDAKKGELARGEVEVASLLELK